MHVSKNKYKIKIDCVCKRERERERELYSRKISKEKGVNAFIRDG